MNSSKLSLEIISWNKKKLNNDITLQRCLHFTASVKLPDCCVSLLLWVVQGSVCTRISTDSPLSACSQAVLTARDSVSHESLREWSPCAQCVDSVCVRACTAETGAWRGACFPGHVRNSESKRVQCKLHFTHSNTSLSHYVLGVF